MPKIPVIAIIGRPNVGKSTLVNRIVGARKAIVDDLPGVTRDRAYYDGDWQNFKFTLVDTGGLVTDDEGDFTRQVNEQVVVAMEEADAVLFVVDGTTGVTAMDDAVVKLLRNFENPRFLVVNKIDTREQMADLADFYKMGLGDPYPVSAMHGTVGVGDLLDNVVDALKENGFAASSSLENDETLKLTFVGRPNVGKSSLVNKLLGTERTIVSDIPGTTRDAIDTQFTWNDQIFTLVDTAGVRKKSKVSYGVELFSVDRAIRSLKQADVTILVIDAVEGLTDQDKRLIETSNEAGKGLLLVVNKWDLIENKSGNVTGEYEKKLHSQAPHCVFAPIVFVSAKTGQRVDKILETAVRIQENRMRRIKTSVVNELLHEAMNLSPPPPVKNKRLHVYYGTQVDVAPPTFLLFVNSDKLMPDGYRRYLERRIRESVELTGAPIVIACRNKPEK